MPHPLLPPGKSVADLSPRDAARILLMLQDAEDTFLGFVRMHHHEWVIPDFQLELINILDALEKRTLLHPTTGKPVYNLLINMPPRHNKSTLATKLFPAYCAARAPWTQTLVSTASQDLADLFGHATRQYIEDPLTGLAFPNISLDKSTRARHDWATLDGGRYLAIGQSGTTVGRAANLLVLDDPYSGRPAAESPTQRLAIKQHWDGSLYLRREPDARGRPPITILIHTRWHPDDLTGNIIDSHDYKEGRWYHVCYKGIMGTDRVVSTSRAALDPKDPDYIPSGDPRLQEKNFTDRWRNVTQERALWPARFPLEELHLIRRRNEREFAAQYQQEPYVSGGQIIKSSWWRFTGSFEDIPPLTTTIITVDAAFKAKQEADYSVILIAGMDANGDIHIRDVVRRKWAFPDLKRNLISINAKWRGRGLRGIYIEDRAAGTSLVQELQNASGVAVIPYKVVHDKVARANAVTPLIEGGRVFLPNGEDWIETFLRECEQFPNSTNDDQVDALVMALDVLSRTPVNNINSLNAPLNPSENSLLAQIRAANPGTKLTPDAFTSPFHNISRQDLERIMKSAPGQ